MKKALFFLFLLGCVCSVTAQNIGFLGRRFMLNADIYTFPAIPANRTEGSFGNMKLRIQTGFDVVTSERGSVGLSFCYGRYPGKVYIEQYSSGSYRTYVRNVSINSFGPILSLKRYLFKKRGNLAPIGPYIEYLFSYIGTRYTVEQASGPINASSYAEKSIWFGLCTGANYVVNKKFVLGFGVQLLGFGFTFASTDVNYQANNGSIYRPYNRFANGNVINIFGRFGYLLF